jgi:hypothetical protein
MDYTTKDSNAARHRIYSFVFGGLQVSSNSVPATSRTLTKLRSSEEKYGITSDSPWSAGGKLLYFHEFFSEPTRNWAAKMRSDAQFLPLNVRTTLFLLGRNIPTMGSARQRFAARRAGLTSDGGAHHQGSCGIGGEDCTQSL